LKDSRFLISVITITLNAETHLRSCLESIVSQKSAEVELVVKDGGSKDGTKDILASYSSHIDILESRPDNGISDAFNQAVFLASGQYVLFVNADDWLEQDAIEKIIQVLRSRSRTQPDLICFGSQFWTGNKMVNRSLANPSYIGCEPSIHHSSCVIRRAAFENYGGFDTAYHYAMDYELLLRFIESGASFVNCKEYIANRRLGGTSYKNNLAAIRETKRARSIYYSGFTLHFWYYYSLLKNLMGRLLRSIGLGTLYRLYWNYTNKKWAKS